MATKVPGFGPLDAKIMVVGEAPGAQEEAAGRPFVGPAGNLLKNFLMQVGIDPMEVRYNNICKYRPPGNKIAAWFSNGDPTEPIIEGILELQDEILEVSPNVIISCGSHPLAMLTGKGRWNKKEKAYTGISDWRGSILDSTIVPGQKVVATYHPSYILQEGYSDNGFFKLDLLRAKEQSEFPELRRACDKKNLVINPRGEDRIRAKHDLLTKSKIIAFDIEYIDNKLLCVGMTNNSDGAVVFAIEEPGDVEFVKDILLSGIPLCAQNAMFDCSILEYWYNIHCMKYLKYDTMLAAHAANIELPKDLGTLASIYTDQPNWYSELDWKDVRAGKIPMRDVYIYNAIDTWVTYAIMEEQLKHEFGGPAWLI